MLLLLTNYKEIVREGIYTNQVYYANFYLVMKRKIQFVHSAKLGAVWSPCLIDWKG